MDQQQFFIKGRRYAADEPGLQEALGAIYTTPERPRCLCQPGGIEMYIANLGGSFVIKRLPDKGYLHDPSCPSYEPEASQSGFGALWREAVQEHTNGEVDLRLAFPMTRLLLRNTGSTGTATREPATEVGADKARMGLLGFLHYLWDRAGFNRFVPAMAGRRNYGVIWKYGREALLHHHASGVDLSGRVYIPEPYNPEERSAILARRHQELMRLHSSEDDTRLRMMLVVGEFKEVQDKEFGLQLWLKHMPDCPFYIDNKTWTKTRRHYATLFEAMDAGTEPPLRMIMTALIYARREYVYQIDRLALMLVTGDTWIPIEGTHELDLVRRLVQERRSFYKPLRFDAKSAAQFANALLLDTGKKPTPLHVVSIDEKDRASKEKALRKIEDAIWVWHTDKSMPPLPPAAK